MVKPQAAEASKWIARVAVLIPEVFGKQWTEESIGVQIPRYSTVILAWQLSGCQPNSAKAFDVENSYEYIRRARKIVLKLLYYRNETTFSHIFPYVEYTRYKVHMV